LGRSTGYSTLLSWASGWSHMLLGDTARFLRGLSNRLRSGSYYLAILDNRYGRSNYPIVRVDSEGNTYQRRSLLTGQNTTS